jgi:hypothetical protein
MMPGNKKAAAIPHRATFRYSGKKTKNGRSTRRYASAGDEAFALRALTSQFAGTAHGLGLFARALFGRLLIMSAHLHFAENTFALHLLFESTKRLINIVVADEYLHGQSCLYGSWKAWPMANASAARSMLRMEAAVIRIRMNCPETSTRIRQRQPAATVVANKAAPASDFASDALNRCVGLSAISECGEAA